MPGKCGLGRSVQGDWNRENWLDGTPFSNNRRFHSSSTFNRLSTELGRCTDASLSKSSTERGMRASSGCLKKVKYVQPSLFIAANTVRQYRANRHFRSDMGNVMFDFSALKSGFIFGDYPSLQTGEGFFFHFLSLPSAWSIQLSILSHILSISLRTWDKPASQWLLSSIFPNTWAIFIIKILKVISNDVK